MVLNSFQSNLLILEALQNQKTKINTEPQQFATLLCLTIL